jgi:hypothetical protein
VREPCARVLGYERTQAIEHALRSIHLSVTHAAALFLFGDFEPISCRLPWRCAVPRWALIGRSSSAIGG